MFFQRPNRICVRDAVVRPAGLQAIDHHVRGAPGLQYVQVSARFMYTALLRELLRENEISLRHFYFSPVEQHTRFPTDKYLRKRRCRRTRAARAGGRWTLTAAAKVTALYRGAELHRRGRRAGAVSSAHCAAHYIELQHHVTSHHAVRPASVAGYLHILGTVLLPQAARVRDVSHCVTANYMQPLGNGYKVSRS